MITFIFKIENLFNLVIQRTVYFSNQLDQSTAKADIIPLTEDDREWFYSTLKEASTRVWEKLGTWAAEESDHPYILDLDGDEASTSTYENHIVFELDPPPAYIPKIQNSLVTNAIQNAYVAFIVSDWLRLKGFDANDRNVQLEYSKHQMALVEIRRYMEYKERPKLKYTTF